jgi:hypothetical protein
MNSRYTTNSHQHPSLLSQFKYHSIKIVLLNCKIAFLTSCLSLGLTPKGLQPKFPIHGYPPQLRKDIILFANHTSIQLVNLTVQLYKNLAKEHSQHLQTIHSHICHFPLIDDSLNNILLECNKIMETNMAKLYEKLRSLYLKSKPDNNPNFFKNNSNSASNQNIENISNTFHNHSVTNTPNFHDTNRPIEPPQLNVDNTVDQLSLTTSVNDQNNYSNVLNLSNYELTENEKSILSKGLTFAPTPKFNQMEFIADALRFARNVKLKFLHSKDEPNNVTTMPNSILRFKEESTWDPPDLPADHPIQQFTNVILTNLADHQFPDFIKTKDNLSKNEKKAIYTLKNNTDIVILPADKGDSIVVLNKEDYVNEIEKQLNDTKFYKQISNNPTEKFNKEIKKLLHIEGPKEDMSANVISLLTTENPRTPVFYILPKIHKPTRPPPGRPIVAGYGSPTERISSYVDEVLQPIVKTLNSHVKNTNHFIERLNDIPQPLSEDVILVSIDVQSLYTNIPHDQGMEAVKTYLDNRPKPVSPSTTFIVNLVNLI